MQPQAADLARWRRRTPSASYPAAHRTIARQRIRFYRVTTIQILTVVRLGRRPPMCPASKSRKPFHEL